MDYQNKLNGSEISVVYNGCDIWSFQTKRIIANENNFVLFNLPMNVNVDLKPYFSPDRWDNDHVRMPTSNESKYIEISNGTKILKSRWNLIEESLLVDFDSSYTLEKAIKNYNTRYSSIWNFTSLHYFVNHQLSDHHRTRFLKIILPKIVSLALRMPQIIQCPIPLLKAGTNNSITMTQEQAGCIIANAFLCTFPRRNTTKRDSEYSRYPDINFSRLYSSDTQKVSEKLHCLINYFDRICTDVPKGVITYSRQSLKLDQFPCWPSETKTFSNIKYYVSSRERIEDGLGMLQVDFANKYIGGGVLGNGLVQEEIRFLINPELIVSRLFTECLECEEAMIITGTEQFNLYTGYATTFRFGGNFIDTTPSDEFLRKRCQIVAIDALSYSYTSDQFRESNLLRELNKAYAGFYNFYYDARPLATGSWGSGAFNGNSLKSALIQLMVCRLTRRNMVFFTFGDQQLEKHITDIFELLIEQSVTIGKLFQILKKFRFSANDVDNDNLSQFIKNELKSGVVQRNVNINSYDNSHSKYPPLLRLVSKKQPNVKPSFLFSKEEEKLKSPPFSNFPVFSTDATTAPQTSTSQFEIINEVNHKPGNNNNEDKKFVVSDQKPKRSLIDSLDDFFM